MKLFAEIYPSPQDNEGTYQNVYIEDVAYKIEAHEETNKPYFFQIEFKMYHFKNDKKVILDEFQQTFLGTNEDLQNGRPTTNKKSIIKILNFEFDPETPQFIEVENPDYDENIEGSEPMISVENPFYIPENGEVNMVKYLSTYGQLPDEYEVIQWGCATAEDAMLYFNGGALNSPKLFITSPFAQEWLKHTIQMKGTAITQFNFID